ncbi:hypothetical protein BJY04DRAFT_220856 [Aspergillus karnatakaensis]|uniref:uncharacterized protein n=1 Tax=Aspergillus karnatakaensis TaxID=1810916 RepID=UPI003CCD1C4B
MSFKYTADIDISPAEGNALDDPHAAAFHPGIDFYFDNPFTSSSLYDWSLPEMNDWTLGPHTTTTSTFQWPMLTPQSLSPSTDGLTDSAAVLDRTSLGKQRQPTPPRGHRSTTKRSDQDSKFKTTQRAHYAVEKRYRSSLNEKYAALTQTLLAETTQRICRTDTADWTIQVEGAIAGSTSKQGAKNRQSKTATLSATIEAIGILTRCCQREAIEVKRLQIGVLEMRQHVRRLLQTNIEENDTT